MLDPLIIIIPFLAAVFMGGYLIYTDYKDKQRIKHEQLLETIPCMCGHAKWIHPIATLENGLKIKRAGCHDFLWSSNCPCTAYRMDNLAYLEKVEKQEQEFDRW